MLLSRKKQSNSSKMESLKKMMMIQTMMKQMEKRKKLKSLRYPGGRPKLIGMLPYLINLIKQFLTEETLEMRLTMEEKMGLVIM